MIDRESAWKRSNDSNAAGSMDSNETAIGISKKAIVYLVIIGLIAVLCVAYVMQIKKARSGGSAPVETVTVSSEASTASTEEAAAAEEPSAQQR